MFLEYKNIIPFLITITLMTVVFIFGMVVILITLQKKQGRKKREYLLSLIAERETTMQLISMEVHDNISQMLNITRMNLYWLQSEITDTKCLARIKATGEIMDTVIMDTNNIGHTLNTAYLMNKGLVRSLKEEIEWITKSRNIVCDLEITGVTQKFDGQKELMIFRIAQEAINNIIKHSGATEITIALEYKEHSFRMAISDNGRGFDYSLSGDNSGVGMHSMNERARIINGEFDIISVKGKGTTIVLKI